MENPRKKRLLARLRDLNAAPLPTDPYVGMPADFGEGFSAGDEPAPTEPLTVSRDTHAPIPDGAFDTDADTLVRVLGILAPTRSYAGRSGPNWKAERDHHHHHALGAVAGHLLVIGTRVLGRRMSDRARRALAHGLHGAAHAVHPDGHA